MNRTGLAQYDRRNPGAKPRHVAAGAPRRRAGSGLDPPTEPPQAASHRRAELSGPARGRGVSDPWHEELRLGVVGARCLWSFEGDGARSRSADSSEYRTHAKLAGLVARKQAERQLERRGKVILATGAATQDPNGDPSRVERGMGRSRRYGKAGCVWQGDMPPVRLIENAIHTHDESARAQGIGAPLSMTSTEKTGPLMAAGKPTFGFADRQALS